MTQTQQILIAQALLATGLVKKVYHNCHMVRNHQNERMYAAYPVGREWVHAGIDDRQSLFAYVRTNGEFTARQFKMDSCSKHWEIFAPLRVVCFHDEEDQDHGLLLTKLATFTYMQGITLQRIIEDKWRLLREESDLTRARFDGRTFYVAFDVLVNFLISHDTCEQAACSSVPNPICL